MKKIQIIYDFDGTLTPKSVPFFPILKDAGVTEKEFYENVNKLKENGISDVYENWFGAFIEILQNSNLEVHDVTRGAKDIIFCEGVEEWFHNLKKECNSSINHYIVTSGIEEYLYASSISKYMTKIFGVTFHYENKKLKEVEKLISDREKVDYIKKINQMNDRKEDDCTNLIYIGDGLTDYYAMDFVFHHGGISILVTPPSKEPEKKLFSISNFQCTADYRTDKELFNYIKKILD